MFKIGDRVEWCKDGRFDLYANSSDPSEHDFGVVTNITGGFIWCEWEYSKQELHVNHENIRKAPSKAPTRKNLKLELRVRGLELTVKVLEQDEVDTCKSYAADGMDFEASNGFILKSEYVVATYSENELFIKGVESGDSYSNEFKSQDKLNTYITRLKQAVKEFNAAGGFAKTQEETVEIVE